MKIIMTRDLMAKHGLYVEDGTYTVDDPIAQGLIDLGWAKKWVPKSERNGVEYGRLGGSKIIQKFLILYDGWEMDNEGYVTEDGRIWWTSHGSQPFEADAGEVMEKLDETRRSANGLIEALRYHRQHGSPEKAEVKNGT